MTAGGPDSLLQNSLGRYARLSRVWPILVKRGIQWGARMATSPLRTLPDFVIIGAQRCGTTSLYNYLVEHPDVAPAFIKETHFFDLYFGRGLNWYRAYFPILSGLSWKEPGAGWLGRILPGLSWKEHGPATAGVRQRRLLTGESTPYYLFHPHAPQRVWEAVPGAKLILLLRNPVDRAYSHYHHEVRMGAEEGSFEEAIEREEKSLASETARLVEDEGYRSFTHMHHSYLARGIYVDQIQRWTELFGRDRILILKSEDFYGDPSASLEQVLHFLGLPVPALACPEQSDREGKAGTGRKQGSYEKYNLGHYAEMDAATRRQLIAYFEPHNQRLFGYLGTDLGWERS